MLATDVQKFQKHVQTNSLILDKDTVEYWSKYSERIMFKHVCEHVNKLEKAKEKYTISWLPNLNMLVKTKTTCKEFPYRSESN
jgi:hypothetical protein